MTVQLDAEQIDALSEIFNIGVGKAAAAMGALMHDEVLLSVPHVSIFTVSEAAQQLGAAGSTMYGVRQPFRGTFNGNALLLVDDAHGFGVLGPKGRGSLAQAGLMGPNASRRVLYMATLVWCLKSNLNYF